MYVDTTIIGTVRLVDGSTSYEGRVEVYHNGEWGRVCGDGWDLNDAQVVCRQLGYDSAIGASSKGYHGWESGQIRLTDVNCVGTELTIKDCLHRGWRTENCTRGDGDADVRCSTLNGNFNLHYNFTISVPQ